MSRNAQLRTYLEPHETGCKSRCESNDALFVSREDTGLKAVRYYGKEDVRVEEVDEPELVTGAVKIAPAFNGLCGSDLSLFFTGPIAPAPGNDTPHPLSGETLPVIFGHEFSGVVTEVADDVDHVSVGDRVVVEPLMVDGTCWACRQGHYNLCKQMGFIGISGRGGGMAQSIVVEQRWVHPIGDMSLEEGALIEPLAVALNAVNRAGAISAETAVVGGGGPIGQLVTAALKAKGLNVILSEVSAARQQIARDAGYADRIVDPTKESLIDVVNDMTDGIGAAFAFDCAGVQAVFNQMFEVIRPTGHVEIVAVYADSVEFSVADALTMQERTLGSSIGYANVHEEAIELVRSGKLNVGQFISSVIDMDDVVDQGLRKLREAGETEVKILVQIDQ